MRNTALAGEVVHIDSRLTEYYKQNKTAGSVNLMKAKNSCYSELIICLLIITLYSVFLFFKSEHAGEIRRNQLSMSSEVNIQPGDIYYRNISVMLENSNGEFLRRYCNIADIKNNSKAFEECAPSCHLYESWILTQRSYCF